jgi:hypothetical protein
MTVSMRHEKRRLATSHPQKRIDRQCFSRGDQIWFDCSGDYVSKGIFPYFLASALPHAKPTNVKVVQDGLRKLHPWKSTLCQHWQLDLIIVLGPPLFVNLPGRHHLTARHPRSFKLARRMARMGESALPSLVQAVVAAAGSEMWVTGCVQCVATQHEVGRSLPQMAMESTPA